MSTEQDYYKTLGLDKNASEAEIKKAYRRLAMKHHPDRNKGDKTAEQEFKKATAAYEVLSDKDKKAKYDQFGHDAFQGGMGGGAGGFSDMGDMGDIFGDIFGEMFSGGRRNGAQQGRDVAYNVTITLEEAIFGVEKTLEFPIVASCSPCKGTGAKNGTAFSTCATCHGQGQVHIQQGFIAMTQTCPTCRGVGKSITDRCKSCHGQGQVKKNTSLKVKIPAGIDNGDRIRISGKGEAGTRGGPNGDLYVQIRLSPHKIFERQEKNLLCEVPIDFVTATLGGEIEVPTMSGKVTLKIPAETQSGSTFRLRGKGAPSTRSSSSGDLMCKVMVEIPVKLNAKQKQALRSFATLLAEDSTQHMPKTNNWVCNIKKFFNT